MKAQKEETLVVPNKKERTEVISRISKPGASFIALFVSKGERKIHEKHFRALKPENDRYTRHGLIPVLDLQNKVRTRLNPNTVRFVVLDGMRYRFPFASELVKPVASKELKPDEKIKAKDVPEVAKKVLKKVTLKEPVPEKENGIIKTVKVPKKAKLSVKQQAAKMPVRRQKLPKTEKATELISEKIS